MRKIKALLPFFAAVFALFMVTSAFIVHQTETVLVVRLGAAARSIQEPGIHFKLPIIEQSIAFKKWLLDYDSEPREILTNDKKSILVDNYAKWRIVDPLLFYQKVRDERGARKRLDDIIYSELREALGNYNFEEIVKQKRSEIMETVTKRSNEQTKTFGVEVVDVRIKGADLPKQNEGAIFQRMQAERIRDAKRYRSEGEESARKIRADADKERQFILADANREAQETRGKADAEALRIYATAYGKDPEFFKFFRSLEVYRESFGKGTTLVLTPDMEILQYFQNSGGAKTLSTNLSPPSKAQSEPITEAAPVVPTTPEKAPGEN